ncbi:MAG: helix-turn-helix domain-containing protein [Opitutaceae bacterium]
MEYNSEHQGKMPDLTQLKKLAYSVNEVAEILGISVVSVYRLLKRGHLRSLPHLRKKIIARAEVVKLLEGKSI